MGDDVAESSQPVRAATRNLTCTVDQNLCGPRNGQEEKQVKTTLTNEAVRFLQDFNQDITANAFRDVSRRSPFVLMEVACSPDSRLSAKIQKITGLKGSAIGCSHWSGNDLSTGDGVRLTLGL